MPAEGALMPLPLMPKATAVWLVDNTTLTFDQIADFCGLHPLEVKGIADGEVAIGIVGFDPIANGQLTREEITRCEADPNARLVLSPPSLPMQKAKGGRYTPVSKRQDRPRAIAWLIKFHPELSDAQVQRLVGTTKATIKAVRERTHWNVANIKAQDPVGLGICSQAELDGAVQMAQKKKLAAEKRKARAERKAARAAEAEAQGARAAAEPAPSSAEAEGETAPPPTDADEAPKLTETESRGDLG
jgi:hypothetical protein